MGGGGLEGGVIVKSFSMVVKTSWVFKTSQKKPNTHFLNTHWIHALLKKYFVDHLRI